jgi:GNAT superfamily N-acetyltransferase
MSESGLDSNSMQRTALRAAADAELWASALQARALFRVEIAVKNQAEPTGAAKSDITVRPLREDDLDTADHIMRLAFGTFLGIPEPTSFMGDAGYVRNRWRADPEAAFGADVNSRLVGSNFATNWGSVGFFGPLTIRPDLWDRGVGKRLMVPVIDCFVKWGVSHAGLFTFSHSQKHVGLYQRFGFWPRFLTAIMSKPVEPTMQSPGWTRYSEVQAGDRESILRDCRQLTDRIYEGLDVSREINAVATLQIGDTVLLWGDAGLTGLAVCHCGPNTEAGSGTCYVKFGAVRSGPTAGQDFARLLSACEEMASQGRLSRLVAGVNAARHEAYRAMLERRFSTSIQGVSMHRPNEAGYNRPGVYLIDDWR